MPRPLLLPIVLLTMLAIGCSGEQERENALLWQDREVWVRMDDGWARAVRLAEGERLALPESRAGETFTALALPRDGAGTIVVTTEGNERRLEIDQARPLRMEIDPAHRVSVETRGVDLVAPRLVRGDREGRTLLLVVADTLRADHLSEELMPEVLRYFGDGTRIEQAYSAASWTLPSMASIFSGRPAVELRTPEGTLISLADEEETLAEALQERGFRGIAATANYTVNHENGFSAGFDLFYAPPVLEHGTAPDVEWVVERALRARQWLSDEDVFLYLHLMEPHEPYRNHENGTVQSAIPRDAEVTDERLARLRAAYRSEVRHLSHGLAPLFAGLGKVELAVFTADHGEELWDHGGVGHGPTLYPEVVRVPLLVRGSHIDARILDEPTSLVNLRSLFTGENRRLFESGQRIVMDTFAHAPPRFGRVDQDGQTIAFAAQLHSPPDLDPIGRWLETHHPPLLFLPAGGGTSEELPERAAAKLLPALVEHFAGFRSGRWVLVRGVDQARLDVRGSTTEAWRWGAAADVEILSEEAGSSLDIRIESPRPWLLFFFPPHGSDPVAIEVTGETPSRQLDTASAAGWLEAGVTTWVDEGRPPSRLRGLEETLDRLEALGYIDR